jgi:DNA-binding response OmpR family regulator
MNKKILVIDDDPDMRLYISGILQSRGYDIKTVETGCEALAAMRNEFFDLVVMDILLPDTNGLDLCLKVKDLNLGNMPVILVSSITDKNIVDHGLKQGADAYIAKPPSPVELVGQAVGLLEQAEARRATR